MAHGLGVNNQFEHILGLDLLRIFRFANPDAARTGMDQSRYYRSSILWASHIRADHRSGWLLHRQDRRADCNGTGFIPRGSNAICVERNPYFADVLCRMGGDGACYVDGVI